MKNLKDMLRTKKLSSSTQVLLEFLEYGGMDGTRTRSLRSDSAMLYPIELPLQKSFKEF